MPQGIEISFSWICNCSASVDFPDAGGPAIAINVRVFDLASVSRCVRTLSTYFEISFIKVYAAFIFHITSGTSDRHIIKPVIKIKPEKTTPEKKLSTR
jgi:hypothetical protein